MNKEYSHDGKVWFPLKEKEVPPSLAIMVRGPEGTRYRTILPDGTYHFVKERTYHTDLDRDDFAPGELLPWQDMSRHLQALEHQVKTLETTIENDQTARWGVLQALEHQFKILEGIIKTYFDEAPSKRIQNLEVFQQEHTERIQTLEKALQTTTDSLKQAHEKIAWHEERIGIEYKPVKEEVDPEQAAEMRSWERANTRFENLPEQGGKYSIYNRAYVDRQFRDGELEY